MIVLKLRNKQANKFKELREKNVKLRKIFYFVFFEREEQGR